MPAPIVVEQLRKVYEQRGTGEVVVALDRLDFTVEPGEILAIVGQTGCGKSTFLNIVLGLERPSTGQLVIDGKAPYEDFNAFKGRIAAIFQQDRLLPWRTALENAKLGLELLERPLHEQIARAREWLDRLGLGKFLHAYPSELSGGMRQRVALARAFAINPEILLADEAFGHLDEVTAGRLRREFVEMTRAAHATAVLVTHQLEEAMEVGDRILVFGRPGRVLASFRMTGDLRADFAEQTRLRLHIQQILDRNVPTPSSNAAASSKP